MLPAPLSRLTSHRHVTSAWELARREAGATAAVLVLALCAWAFLEVAAEVRDGGTEGLDRRLLLSLRTSDGNDPVGPTWLEIAAADLTALGSIAVLALLVMVVAGLFAALRRGREALVVLLASGGGIVISQGLKQLFGRERPDVALRAV